MRAGPRLILTLSIALLTLNYLGAAAVLTMGAATAPTAAALARRAVLALTAAATAWYVQRRAAGVAASESGEVYDLYMDLWRCFYAAYLCLPFAR